MDLTPLRGSRLLEYIYLTPRVHLLEYIYLLPYLLLLLFRMLARRCTITWQSPFIFIYHNLHWINRGTRPTDLCGEDINEFSNQCLEFGLKLWGSFERDLRHQLLWSLLRIVNRVYIERVMLPINVIIVFNRIEDAFLLNEFIVREHPVWEGVHALWSVWRPATEHKVLPWPLAIKNAQLLHGSEPLHSALDVALVSLRTSKACEVPCGCARYVGSGLSKYDGMRCTNRWERISARPMITSIQLSITLASILFKRLSDFVTSLKKVKSKTTVPYIELLNCVPTSDVGTSCLLDLVWCAPATVPPCCCSSNHFATSLLTNEVYAPVSNSVKAVKYVVELRINGKVGDTWCVENDTFDENGAYFYFFSTVQQCFIKRRLFLPQIT